MKRGAVMDYDFERFSDENEDPEDYDDGYVTAPKKRRKVEPQPSEYEDIYSDSKGRDIYSHSKSKKGEHEPSKEKKGCGKFFLRIIILLLVVCLLLFGAVTILLKSYVSKVNFKDYPDSEFSSSSDSEFDTYASSELSSDKKVTNIMLFGIDSDGEGSSRSDSMIMLSVDKRHKEVKLTSFQRDTLVYCPDESNPEGTYHTKLTNAFAYGSIPLSLNTIEANFGVEVEKYISVNFETFKTIVDILGGVDIELTDREILYINCQIAQNNQTEYLDAEAGVVRLSGEQALWYARNRGGDIINGVDFTEGTDWDRTERQRKFLEAIFSSLKKAPVTKLMKIAREVTPHLTTNLTEKEIMSLCYGAPFYLRYELKKTSMPSEGTWHYDYNYAGDIIYVDDWQKTREDLGQFIYGE